MRFLSKSAWHNLYTMGRLIGPILYSPVVGDPFCKPCTPHCKMHPFRKYYFASNGMPFVWVWVWSDLYVTSLSVRVSYFNVTCYCRHYKVSVNIEPQINWSVYYIQPPTTRAMVIHIQCWYMAGALVKSLRHHFIVLYSIVELALYSSCTSFVCGGCVDQAQLTCFLQRVAGEREPRLSCWHVCLSTYAMIINHIYDCHLRCGIVCVCVCFVRLCGNNRRFGSSAT